MSIVDTSLHFTRDSLIELKSKINKNMPVGFKTGHGFVDWDSLSDPSYEQTFYTWKSGKIVYHGQVKICFNNDVKAPKIIRVAVLDGKKLVHRDKQIKKREKEHKKEPPPPPPPKGK